MGLDESLLTQLLTYKFSVFACKYDILENTVSGDRKLVQKWPFDLKKVNGVYELHLNYQTELKNFSEFNILDQYVLQDGAKNRLLKFRDLIDIPDKLWKLPIDPRVTLLYPQAINISDAINRLIDRKPLNEVSEFCTFYYHKYLSRNQ
ncbi:unnamed protein product [Rodentolepis nana]|uniref:Transcriptional regulator n=1 Tax=Rodentolepis nana TaxID=102285 RepID=A0A0R3THZ0_RODNA|nr:unnamed protein product [Rodentolepis nana]